MKYWEKYISEEMSSADKKKAAEDIMDELKGGKKKTDKDKKKKKSDYTKYLEKQLKYKRQKYEDQKKREKEKRKERTAKQSAGKARQALSSIKQQSISYKDPEPTAYKKAIENVGSAAAGIGKAAFYALKSRRQKGKAEEEPSRQPEKKKPGKPGRRPKPKQEVQQVQVKDTSSTKGETKKISGGPERKRLVPATKRLTPATKKLPPSGGTPYQSEPAPSRETGMSLGQRARRNTALKSALIKSRMEEYSNWKEEFIFEVDNKMNKVEKEKIIDIMKGKNKIEINPTVTEDHKEIATGEKKDDEGYMANVELDQMERAIRALRKKIKKSDMQMPAWVQSKITRAADYIDTAAEYLQSEAGINEESDEMPEMRSRTVINGVSSSGGKKSKVSPGKLMRMLNPENSTKKKKKGDVREEKEDKRYCKLCKKTESKGECAYGPSMWEKNTISEMAPLVAALGRVALGAGARQAAATGTRAAIASAVKDAAKEKLKAGIQNSLNRAGQRVQSADPITPEESSASAYRKALSNIVGEEVEITESKKSKMPCNKPKAEAHGSGETGKSHVVKACEDGKEKLIRFGQLGVKGSPKKGGESKEYASRRHRFQTRHAKNIAKGKMSAAYWANKVKW